MNKRELLEKLRGEGFNDNLITAIKKVPREKFISKELEKYAYGDIALPLESGATISQPFTIAFMLNLLELKKGQKILEIGSGCGYVLALLHEITKGEIYGIEIIKELAVKSKKILRELKYDKIKVICKNGYFGLKENLPFDRILVSASADKIPEHLFSQLRNNGIMVVPVRNSIFRIKKKKERILTEEFPGFAFVPLVE